jgi:hypothetical protein
LQLDYLININSSTDKLIFLKYVKSGVLEKLGAHNAKCEHKYCSIHGEHREVLYSIDQERHEIEEGLEDHVSSEDQLKIRSYLDGLESRVDALHKAQTIQNELFQDIIDEISDLRYDADNLNEKGVKRSVIGGIIRITFKLASFLGFDNAKALVLEGIDKINAFLGDLSRYFLP